VSCESLAKLAIDLVTEFSDDLRRQAWRPYAIVAGLHGGTDQLVWRRLVSAIEDAAGAQAKNSLLMHHRPRLVADLSCQRQMEIAAEIRAHLEGGGGLGMLTLMTKSEWRHFIKGATVTAGQPAHRDHFEALECLARLEHLRTCLEPAWDAAIGGRISQPFSSLGATPELSCRAIIPEIRRCLDWHKTVWIPLADRLRAEGLKLDEVLASIPCEVSQVSEYLAIERLATELLPPLLDAEIGRRRLKECDAAFATLADLAAKLDPSSPDAGVVGRVVQAVKAREFDAYAAGIDYLRRLHAIRPLTEERKALLGCLDLVAPAWAEQIASRVAPHGAGAVPGDVATAWVWRQLSEILDAHSLLDPQAMQREIETGRETLRQLTQWLIDARAWGNQLRRLQSDHAIRPALVGWLDTQKRLASTRQVDRRQAYLAESRKLMKKCAAAVPVWVMPISIMAESFDPATTRFDVVIIDEASQADLNALIPLYMGKQIVVVGDHEQVTPLGVGQGQVVLDNLRKSILQDIPNSHLFDNQFSIYDIGRQSFGDAIRLVEHFRCVPEIIAFSNQLSYDGKIRALRESNSSDLKPACVPCRVSGIREGDTNKGEARQIIDTIKAMIKHPRYDRKTIGVISMLGEAQATLIQSMIHREIPGTEIERRRIRAGISAEFQGDERNVIFLSMVDSPAEEGPLRTTGEGAFEQTKKRYNVAASRAQDQLWVMHSFDPDLHLRAGDLRLKLLHHAKDPLASLRSFNQEVGKTESPFEREVLRRLTSAGFRVKSQWQVGYYRIDMVVEGGGKRLAVECDGDRYHPVEKLADDMDRQAILERLGWEFVRIRGSAFYRNPDLAMKGVFERLEDLGITPEASNDEAPASDKSLIHELDQLIAEIQTLVPDVVVNESDEVPKVRGRGVRGRQVIH
jgi:very-short-patch-repair endonuclease